MKKTQKQTTPAGKSFPVKAEPETEKVSEWETVGWLNRSKSGKAFTVYIGEVRQGVISAGTLQRFLDGKIKGCPINQPVKA